LLIDDVQFLEGKAKVQEEFFHTFNAVQKVGGQIVMTSDRPPHEISGLEERLLSRFEGGLLVDVQNPDFELRCAILRIKAQQKGLDLDINIAKILAANVESIRKLEGLLTLLIAQARVKKIPLSEDLARQIIGKPSLNTDTKPKISVLPNQVVEVIIKKFNLSVSQIKGSRRSRSLARPRQILMYLLRTELSLSLDEVGTWVGGRDHSTVIHAVDTISNLLSTDIKMREDVEWIKHELYG
jgi:chromosomal replication initiator protein